MVYGYTSLLVAQSETYLGGGRLDDAARIAVEALPRARERGERGDEGWLSCMLGAIALRRGRSAVGEAIAQLEEAIALARRLEMRPLEARALAGLGQAHLQGGKLTEAQSDLEEAVSLMRSTAMHRWLGPAEELLARSRRETP